MRKNKGVEIHMYIGFSYPYWYIWVKNLVVKTFNNRYNKRTGEYCSGYAEIKNKMNKEETT